MTRTPIAIFARVPEPGLTKTRLVPALGERGAAELYAAFLRDTVARCTGADGLDPELWIAGDPDGSTLADLAGPLPRRRQRGGDLGARMAHALGRMIERAGRGVVVGSDAPTLPAVYLGLAREALDRGAEAVVGPSADGGYYLVGARDRVPPLFEGIRWSSPHTLHDTLGRARAAGARLAMLPPWYDVDTPADLRLLRAHLAVSPRAAPHTVQHLATAAQRR